MATDHLRNDRDAATDKSSQQSSTAAVSSRLKGTSNLRKGNRSSDGADGGRKRKSGSDRRDRYSFSDGVERAACTQYRHRLPPDFPVEHRTGIAALVPRIVARRTAAVLLCDCVHDGPHSWPDGDLVDETPT